MSLSAIVVMLGSIAALWGVATLTLVHSMRQEERKLALIESQGGFEPFSPRAAADIEGWLARHPDAPEADDMRELLQQQRDALQRHPRTFYDWPHRDA